VLANRVGVTVDIDVVSERTDENLERLACPSGTSGFPDLNRDGAGGDQPR